MNSILNKKNTQNLLHGSILVFAIVIAIYFYINVSIVYGIIQHKKINIEISKAKEEILNNESDINSIHSALRINNLSDYKLSLSGDDNIYITKDVLTSLSLNYGQSQR